MPAPREELTVVICHPSAAIFEKMIAERFPQIRTHALTNVAGLDQCIGEADALLAMQFPVDHFDRAKKLRWFQSTSAGVDSLMPIRDRLGSLQVTNARGIHGEVIADYVMAGVVMLHWNMRRFLHEQTRKEWKPRGIVPLAEKSLGVVGLGAIGATIARRAKSAGMTVYGTKRDVSVPVAGVDGLFAADALKEMLPLCDFVVLALPGTPDTRHAIGASEIACIRPDAFLINIARGFVVDEGALIQALQRQAIAGAMLDVFETEPLPQDNPLWELSNVIVTPHTAGFPDDYARRLFSIFADNVERFLSGKPLRNVVDMRRGY